MGFFPRCLIVAASVACLLAADPFPKIQTETLTGKPVELPDATKGHPTLLIIGFSHGSRVQTKAWNERVERDFAQKLSVYTIVVLEDAPKLVRGMAVHGVKSGTPPERRDRTLLVYHYEKELKLTVDFGRPDDAYILLLDSNGEVIWKSHGTPTDDAIKAIRAAAGV